ncbi:MAG: hypothetical protein JOY64_24820 [Alphaproteobacteria bacterium]|nr:hypothetical protein [Alphaproteobacteria bacterium]
MATIPRSGTWFLRYAVAFLAHLDRGGRIDNRLTGRIIGDPHGPPFDFSRLSGGPLFYVRGTMPVDLLFVGHTVCPGFAREALTHPWWPRTSFHVRGYDYLHEGFDYACTPVDLAPYPHAPLRVSTLERDARKGRAARIALVYRNPIDQAASYYWYCQNHRDSTYNSIGGRPLSGMSFGDYLFGHALPSYAKQLISYQHMALHHPTLVRLFSYEGLMRAPVRGMTAILDHLDGTSRDRPSLRDAVRLAQRDHLKAVERTLGRSLDGTRRDDCGHMRHRFVRSADRQHAASLRGQAIETLEWLGIDTALLEWPEVEQQAAHAA